MTSQIDWLAVSETLAENSLRLIREAQQLLLLDSASREAGLVKGQTAELTTILAKAITHGVESAQKS